MLQKGKGIDILSEVGCITSVEAGLELLKIKMDAENAAKIDRIKNPDILLKIANAAAMCAPDSIFVNNGSKEDRQFIRDLALKTGEEAPLPMPDHTIHYDLKDEQGRIIDRTFYIAITSPTKTKTSAPWRTKCCVATPWRMSGIK